MDRKHNIFSHLIKNENDTTELLYALLTYRPFRDSMLHLFTNGSIQTADISWDDVYTQKAIGGGIPDLSILGKTTSILVEVKTTSWRGLTGNQPQSYLQWLAAEDASKSRYFVVIVPPVYYHIQELKDKIESFHSANVQNAVVSRIVTWEDVVKSLQDGELDQLNQYIRDFCDLLTSWYENPIIKLTFDEVNKMFDANTAKGMRKLLTVIDEVVKSLEQKGYRMEYSFKKKWWEGEYGIYLKYNDQYVLWFGLWQDYWEKTEHPMCFGVHKKWDSRICAEFKKIHPTCTIFPTNDPNPYYLMAIQKDVLLSEDPATLILGTLEMNLQLLSAQLN